MAYAIAAVTALSAYYLIAIVAVHYAVFRCFDRHKVTRELVFADLTVIFVSWAIAMSISWAHPLGTWLFGSHENLNDLLPFITLAIALIVSTIALNAGNAGNVPSRRRLCARVFNTLSLAIFVILSLRQDFFGDSGSALHWGLFVGPAELVRQGGWLLWDVPSQYGFLSIITIAMLPFASAWTSLYALDAALVFASACMLFFMFRSLRLGSLSIAFSLLMTVVLVYLAPGAFQVLSGPQAYPSGNGTADLTP